MKPRRKDLTPEELEIAKQMEMEGKSRTEIALFLGISKSAVTRHLGAVRPYRDKRKAA